MERTIEVQIKDVYGRLKAYPVCTDAERFAKIAGTKTLTRDTLQTIKDLGYTIDFRGRWLLLGDLD